ncbi:hypothetical protein ACFZB5_34500 [Streptomyces nodosus]|uniref:hypothetical protein n=1 Tax=Streptomyces nodosus TaxID=40318 RepID=UPI0036E7E277
MTDTRGSRGEGSAGPPGPAAQLAELDEEQLRVLRRVGHAWGRVSASPEAWRRALPVDPDLGAFPPAAQVRPARFGRLIPLSPLGVASPGEQVDTEESPPGRLGHAAARVRRLVLGPR